METFDVLIDGATGEEVERVAGQPPPPAALTPVDLFAALDPVMAEALLTAAAGFVNRAGDLWDAFVAIPVEDPAHDAIGVVTDIALTAALPLVEEP